MVKQLFASEACQCSGKNQWFGVRYLGNREIEGAGEISCEPFVPGHEEGKYYSK